MMMTLDERINGLDLMLIEEDDVPPDKRGTSPQSRRDGAQKHLKEHRLVDEFIKSDMRIASVEIPSYIDKRTFTLFVSRLYMICRKHGIKLNKRDRKIYLSKQEEN